MEFATAYYIITYFPRLLGQFERAALNHHYAMFKIGSPEKYSTSKRYQQRINFYKDLISTEPQVLSLLDSGIEQFYINAAIRIMDERAEDVFLNLCPKCNQLARTPYARQCKHCGYSWHETIGATFLVRNIFTNTNREHLFISGDIKSGTVNKGMKIDLTFFGIGKKPTIELMEFLDVSEKRAEVALGIIVKSDEEKEYLKKRKSLAVPITIENV